MLELRNVSFRVAEGSKEDVYKRQAMSFDDVVISIFVNGPRLNTLPVKVYAQLKTGVTPEINALCTIILVVITAVLLLSSFLSKRAEKKY